MRLGDGVPQARPGDVGEVALGRLLARPLPLGEAAAVWNVEEGGGVGGGGTVGVRRPVPRGDLLRGAAVPRPRPHRPARPEQPSRGPHEAGHRPGAVDIVGVVDRPAKGVRVEHPTVPFPTITVPRLLVLGAGSGGLLSRLRRSVCGSESRGYRLLGHRLADDEDGGVRHGHAQGAGMLGGWVSVVIARHGRAGRGVRECSKRCVRGGPSI